MRKVLLLMLVAIAALAKGEEALVPASVSITALIDNEGSATVRENYDIYVDENGLKIIEELENQFGSSFFAWASSGKIKGFDYHIGRNITDIKNITTVIRKKGPNMINLTVKYDVPNASILEKDLPDKKIWLFNAFNFPVVEGAIKVPEEYTITIILPAGANVIKVEPEPEESKRILFWSGPFSTNAFYVRYSTVKIFAFPGIVEIIRRVSPSTYFIAFISLTVIILVWKRKTIRQKIKEYVEENSQLEK